MQVVLGVLAQKYFMQTPKTPSMAARRERTMETKVKTMMGTGSKVLAGLCLVFSIGLGVANIVVYEGDEKIINRESLMQSSPQQRANMVSGVMIALSSVGFLLVYLGEKTMARSMMLVALVLAAVTASAHLAVNGERALTDSTSEQAHRTMAFINVGSVAVAGLAVVGVVGRMVYSESSKHAYTSPAQ